MSTTIRFCTSHLLKLSNWKWKLCMLLWRTKNSPSAVCDDPPLSTATARLCLFLRQSDRMSLCQWIMIHPSTSLQCLCFLYFNRARKSSESSSLQRGGLHHLSVLSVSQRGSCSQHGHRPPEGILSEELFLYLVDLAFVTEINLCYYKCLQ